jgi:predicted house-cleaning noncanonical NTP pyrophosphatase (MazG superfamily)
MRTDKDSRENAKPPKKMAVVLRPNRSLVIVERNTTHAIDPVAITVEKVGCKAFGLTCLPAEWVPPFFVIDADCAHECDASIREQIGAAVEQTGVTGPTVMVRSSGATETMGNRGRLVSQTCTLDEVPATITRLHSLIADPEIGKVHWIVQTFQTTRRRGHLSNERHLVYENRDWIAEVELQGDLVGYATTLGVRKWREGADVSNRDLSCVSELQVTLRLRRVARWATASAERVHFEWVWDGARLWLVQADIADKVGGTDPTTLLPVDVPDITVSALSGFQVAADHHFTTYNKLRNAKLYSDLGYEMPRFYVLSDRAVISAILKGEIPPSLRSDLSELTRRPLIIRTDGTDIPPEKREMLPRSDELRSPDEAQDWLLGDFRTRIEASELQSASLCLIAHHFIPSVAAAWARAEPGRRMVRIESLWGLPEGLYWYSHDTFEVDTQEGILFKPKAQYPYWKRLRYKGTFIAPDASGRWIPYHTDARHDWRPSITREKWIFEIASTTRMIADREEHATAVMWFIDNDRRASKHAVLPWFHNQSELEGMPKAAPRRKLTIARDYTVEKRGDWQELQQQIGSGRHIERIVVRPTDPYLIRNREFAEELATFAAQQNIVVELAGGVLSHAFYVLQRSGAQVECIDLFGADEDVVEYNKVVRDKIPAVIESRGEKVEVVQLTGDALLAGLRQKLVEEAYEALDAKAGDDLIAELADVQEVLNAIVHALQLNRGQLEKERVDKSKRRGGFERGYMLRRTATPHSLSSSPLLQSEGSLAISPRLSLTPVISDAANIPSNAPYRRPDLRNVAHELEKLFTFETELNKVGTAKETTSFELPLGDEKQGFTLSVEFTRIGADLRGSVRLRVRPKQLSFSVPDSQLTFGFSEEK